MLKLVIQKTGFSYYLSTYQGFIFFGTVELHQTRLTGTVYTLITNYGAWLQLHPVPQQFRNSKALLVSDMSEPPLLMGTYQYHLILQHTMTLAELLL